MKKYIVLMHVSPAVRMTKENAAIEWDFPNDKGSPHVRIESLLQNLPGSERKIQSGLKVKIALGAEDLATARSEAMSLGDAIMSFLTLVTGVPLDIPRLDVVYEVTSEVEERDFLQIFYDPVKIPVSRKVVEYHLLANIVDKIRSSDPSVKGGRIARAIRWYRMGTRTNDLFDRFNCFWIGMESLNPLLQNVYSVKDDPTICPKCKHTWISTPTVSGIRKFVKREIDSGNLYKRIRSVRIAVMHSTDAMDPLLSETKELNTVLGEILFRAILMLLEIPDWEKIPYTTILDLVPLSIEFEVDLIGGDSEQMGLQGKHPHFELDQSGKFRINKDGSIDFKGKSNFLPKLSAGISYRGREVRFIGDIGLKGSIDSVS